MKNMDMLEGETPISAIRLVRSVLVKTDQGERDASAGDWLVITSLGRQVVMSDRDYLATMVSNEPVPAVDPETVEPVDTPPEKPIPDKKNVFASLFGRKKPVHPVPIVPSQEQVELEQVPIGEAAAVIRPPIPSKPYTPIDPDSVVIPPRPEGSFLAFMRPGATAPKKKKSALKKTITLPFQKKKKSGKEKKERYRYIRPDWI